MSHRPGAGFTGKRHTDESIEKIKIARHERELYREQQFPRNEHDVPEAAYRLVYRQYHGDGPYECWHCHLEMLTLEVVHHIDENHLNHSIENLAAVHKSCHTVLHHTGQKRSVETRRKITDRRRGKPLSEKHLEAMRSLMTPEVRAKISLARTGQQLSDETRQKLRQARGRCECGLETNRGNVSRHCQRTGHKRVA